MRSHSSASSHFGKCASYRAAGYEQGDATNECYSAISRHELYAQLYEYYNGAWYMMASGADAAASRKLQVHPAPLVHRAALPALAVERGRLGSQGRVLVLASRYTQNNDYCG